VQFSSWVPSLAVCTPFSQFSCYVKQTWLLRSVGMKSIRVVIAQGGIVLNWDRGGLGWILGRSFSPRGWWRTEQVAQGGCGCPIPGGIRGQAGCGSGQPGLVVGDPAHSRGVETRWSLVCFSTQPILWFCDSFFLSNEQWPFQVTRKALTSAYTGSLFRWTSVKPELWISCGGLS